MLMLRTEFEADAMHEAAQERRFIQNMDFIQG
jgi:hypothetical protein